MRNNRKFEEDYFEGFYKSEVGEYSKKRDDELANWFRGMYSYVNKFVPIKNSSGKTILEFGCAYGAASSVLNDYGLKVTGTDISKLAVDRARKLHPEITFKTHDMQKLFKSSKKFDFAIANDVIEHLGRPETAIKNVYKILKPHGIAIFSTQNDFDYKVQDPTHISVKNYKEWRKICYDANFSKIIIKRVTFFPPYLYRRNWRLNFVLPFPSSTTVFLSTVFIFAFK
jgi:2-polyprenyl-3-methyl-5-hydroxy-6-metoxy-1,4-benzoquinol methylase